MVPCPATKITILSPPNKSSRSGLCGNGEREASCPQRKRICLLTSMRHFTGPQIFAVVRSASPRSRKKKSLVECYGTLARATTCIERSELTARVALPDWLRHFGTLIPAWML
jgi:hypothetical protein